jgi:hypothetical protein
MVACGKRAIVAAVESYYPKVGIILVGHYVGEPSNIYDSLAVR